MLFEANFSYKFKEFSWLRPWSYIGYVLAGCHYNFCKTCLFVTATRFFFILVFVFDYLPLLLSTFRWICKTEQGKCKLKIKPNKKCLRKHGIKTMNHYLLHTEYMCMYVWMKKKNKVLKINTKIIKKKKFNTCTLHIQK